MCDAASGRVNAEHVCSCACAHACVHVGVRARWFRGRRVRRASLACGTSGTSWMAATPLQCCSRRCQKPWRRCSAGVGVALASV
jgi:hypothetical protein